jgi:pilus assembly protein CpaF
MTNMTQNTDDLGPLEILLQDDQILEILINGYDKIYFEKHGKMQKADVQFDDNDHLMDIIQRILTQVGRKADESTPILDMRLSDGSRVHVVIPPIAITGPSVTIRKFPRIDMTIDRLIEYGSLTAEIADFIRACVQSRLNIVVAGGTGSGKTTVFNVFAEFIPNDERIIVLQNVGEIKLPQEHLVVLETRPANLQGKGEITMTDLVESAVKMRPDRILVNEVNGGEVWGLLQAINVGHDGAMFNMHANGPRDVLTRMEVMATESNPSLPLLAIRHNIATAIDLILIQERLHDGSRRIMKITEVTGMQGDFVTTQDIFEFVPGDKTSGEFRWTGNIPTFLNRLEGGYQFPPA